MTKRQPKNRRKPSVKGDWAILRQKARQQAEKIQSLEVALARSLDDLDAARSSLEEITTELRTRRILNEPTEYQQLVHRVHKTVRRHVPRGATLLVVNKGDSELLKTGGRLCQHFPQQDDGEYAGYHPSCSLAAIAHLESLRARGAEYLLFPKAMFWWFEHYPEFKHHIHQRYRLLLKDEHTCVIYSLNESSEDRSTKLALELSSIVDQFEARFNREPSILDCHPGLSLERLLPKGKIFSPLRKGASLPYLNSTVDLVVAAADDPAAVQEARRVAKAAVLMTTWAGNGDAPKLNIEWLQTEKTMPLKPVVSIIISCRSGHTFTDACLRSLFETLPAGLCPEIIAVDDAMTDATPEVLKRWKTKSHMKTIRNRRNVGFARSCNAGARVAEGEVLIILSDSVVLLPDWLSPLLRIFRNFPDAGGAGGRLLLPSGSIHGAGGILFRDGSGLGVGRGDTNIDAPRYAFVREVDFCSAVMLATPRSVWEELGGFDTRYLCGGSEEIDYCLRLGKAGRRVYYQPQSAAVCHFPEPMASMKKIINSEFKNRSNLKKRWCQELAIRREQPEKLDESEWEVLATDSLRTLEGEAA